MKDLATLLNLRVFGLETSSYCNRHCSLCPRTQLPPNRFHEKDKHNPVKEYLDDKYVFTLLRQLGEANFSGRVQLFHLNEPLYDPRVPAFVKFASEHGLKVRITTNGNPIKATPSLLDEIVPYVRELGIGIYDYDIRSEGWQEKRNELIKYWSKVVGEYDSHDFEVRFSLKENFRSVARDLKCGYAINAPCKRVLDGVYVLYNGDVTHCCSDGIGGTVFGNVKKNSLVEILSSKERAFVLDALKKGERWRFASCRDCLDSIVEEKYANDPQCDRDGEILRLGLKYGLTPYPPAGTKTTWTASDYLNNGNIDMLVIAPLSDEFRIGDGSRVFFANSKQKTQSSTPLEKQNNLIVPQHKKQKDKMQSIHNTLVEQIEKHYSADLPNMLLIGEGRLFRNSVDNKCLMQLIYEGFEGSYNILHYPLTMGSIRNTQKHLHVWASVEPDIFVYCMGVLEGKVAEGSTEPKVDLDTFSFMLKMLIRSFQEIGTKRVIILTPMPVVSAKNKHKKWLLSNEMVKKYSDAAIQVAVETDVDVIDVFGLCMENKQEKMSNEHGRLMVETVINGILK